MTDARRLLLQAQVAFWVCVALCFAFAGGGLGDNHGFSVYGGNWSTIAPWAVGIAAASFLILRAARALEPQDHELAWWLRVNVVLLLSVLFTPDTVDRIFYEAHVVASVALFLFQAVVGLWLVRRRPGTVILQLYVAQIGGGVVAGLSQLQWIGLLSPGIFVFQVAFGALLVLSVASQQRAPAYPRQLPVPRRSDG